MTKKDCEYSLTHCWKMHFFICKVNYWSFESQLQPIIITLQNECLVFHIIIITRRLVTHPQMHLEPAVVSVSALQ